MTICDTVTHWSPLKAYKTLEERFIKIHNNKYDYANTVYKGGNTLIDIVCPIHGTFKQLPNVHLAGKGCTECGQISAADHKRCSFKEFAKRANNMHDNKFKYIEMSFHSLNERVGVICPKHGVFYSFGSSHLGGSGCRQCTYESYFTSKETIVKNCIEMHGNLYDYTNSEYRGYHTPMNIFCTKCEEDFPQVPATHIRGAGCPTCRDNGGYRVTKPGLLYYLSINEGEAYKIGITNRTVKQRYKAYDLEKIQVLHEVWYENGADALKEEQRILKRYKDYKYNGVPLLNDGNTELFRTNILNIKDT